MKLILLKRGERFAFRIKDNQSPFRAEFRRPALVSAPSGLANRGQVRRLTAPTKLVMDTIVGGQRHVESPGYVTFEREGKTYQTAGDRSEGWLALVRLPRSHQRPHDRTAARGSSTPSRPKTASVVLDFNKAINLPCAYIPYATCPLAPPQNRLSLAIEAGELKYEPPSGRRRVTTRAMS